MLHVTTWRWGTKYGPEYVERLARGLSRHLSEPYRFIVCEPHPEDIYLTEIPGCFCRLRMFNPAWQASHGIGPDDRLVCVDLDVIVTGPLDPLFAREEPFVILQGANAANPCPFNGSLMFLRAGAYPEVWTEFSLEAAASIPRYSFADDQGWIHHMIPGAAGWKAGAESGVFAFMKPGWPTHTSALPEQAKMVVFPGRRDPSQFTHLDWVRRHWL